MPAAIAPLLIALASFVLRLVNLGSTKGYIFDEVYYVDGARDLLKYGVEVTDASQNAYLSGFGTVTSLTNDSRSFTDCKKPRNVR